MKTNQLVLVVFGATIVAALALGLWMRQTFDYQPVEGLTEISIGGQSFEVRDYVGVDNPDAPSRLRGCFTVLDPEGAVAAGTPAPGFEPFAAPDGFDCWRPKEMHEDLLAGRATALIAEVAKGRAANFERIVVVYPDGRAYQQRRLVQQDGF